MKRISYKNIKYSLINFLRLVIYFSGAAFLVYSISKNGAIVLTYHRVNNTSYDPSITVSVKNFEKQIEYLAKRRRVVSLEDLITYIQNGIGFPKGSVVITFDDGYRDNYTNAYPILKKYNMPFTIFLTTDYIGSDKLIWYDELRYKIKESNCDYFELKTNNSERYNIGNKKGKSETFVDLLRLLIDSSEEKRKALLLELDDELRVKVPKRIARDTMLSLEDIKEMSVENQVSFGAHTCSHCRLTSVSLEDAKEEIVGSKLKIEKEIGKEIKLFSYPYGGYNERIKQILEENGFDCAVTINYGNNALESDFFELKRIGVNDSFWLFKYNLMCVEVEERLRNIYYKIFKRLGS